MGQFKIQTIAVVVALLSEMQIMAQIVPFKLGNAYNLGPAYGVAVSGHYAFVANSFDGLRIYDVSNPAMPINVGHTNNGATALDVSVSGDFAYLANREDGLRVYDVSDPSKPINIGHAYEGGLAGCLESLKIRI